MLLSAMSGAADRLGFISGFLLRRSLILRTGSILTMLQIVGVGKVV
jgi:hypothetical protein